MSSLLPLVNAFIRDYMARRAKRVLWQVILLCLAAASLFLAFACAMAAIWIALAPEIGAVYAALVVACGFLVIAILLFSASRMGSLTGHRSRVAMPTVAVVQGTPAINPENRIPLLLAAIVIGLVAGASKK